MSARKNKWFWFQSYDRRSSGIVPAEDLEEVYKHAGTREVKIWAVKWDRAAKEFRKGRLLKK